MSAVHVPGMKAPPSTAYKIVAVAESYREVIQRHGLPGTFVESVDVWWFINHYETYCREHGIPINKQLYI